MGDEKKESRFISAWNLYRSQIALLTYKNFLLSKRNIKSSLFQIFSPVILGLFLIYLQHLALESIDVKKVNTSLLPISEIPKCHGAGCVTIGVGLTNGSEPWVEYVLDYLGSHYDLKLGQDIQVYTQSNPFSFIDHLRVHYNQTQTGVIFCTGQFNFTIPNITWPHSFQCNSGPTDQTLNMYSILMNNTNLPLLFLTNVVNPMPMDLPTLAVKLAIDNAILSYHTGVTTPSISLELQSFPMITSRYYAGYDVVSVEGAFWYFIPPMVTFVVVLEELVREKEYRLRQGLMVMGMSSTPYWHSWFFTGLSFIFLSSNVVIASGCMYDFAFFRNTPYLILLSLFGFFGLAMLTLAFVLATLLPTTKAAYTVSYAFLLVGLVLQMFMTNVVILYLLYSDAIPHWVVYVRTILELYPPFNFSKGFGDIARKAARRYSSEDHQWVDGPGYSYHDYVTPIDGQYHGVVYHAPSTLQTVFTMLENAAIFVVIAWVLDHVVTGNRGSGEPIYFPLTRKFWGCKRRSHKQVTSEVTSELLGAADTVMEEKAKVQTLENASSEVMGIRLCGLSKTYFKYPFKIHSEKDVKAVEDIYLEVEPDQLVAMLGHNGAGKSTLINVLTGVLSPTSGYGLISGCDIEDQMGSIRKIIGYCPQHDILWNELTAREHLRLFAWLKGVPKTEIPSVIDERLAEVTLSDVGDALVGTYSGGMKRRLSVAIAGIGSPKLLILDEPTTGMDPISRRQVWRLIQKLKKSRVILLTTHSMEEADVLSDRIVVIVDGRLKCLGTSLYLKNQFGDGYRIALVTPSPDTVKPVIDHHLPSLHLLDESASSLVFTTQGNRDFFHLFEALEGEDIEGLTDLKREVSDWGISHTTLEEVFMKVTGKKQTEEAI